VAELTKEQESLFHKIRSILKKAESTPFEHEAAAFFEKAQQLIARNAVDEELLWASDPSKRELIIQEDIAIEDRATGVHSKRELLHRIAANNRCRMWYSPGRNKSTVAGYPNDVAFCMLLYSSVVSQCNFAMAHALARSGSDGRGSSRVFRKEFIYGFVDRVTERLREQQENIREWLSQQESTGTTDLVIADRKHKVDEWVRENIRLGRAKEHNFGKTNIAARGAGRVAGETADLSGGRGGNVERGRKELNA
jgi:hypothetical protein